MNDLLVITVSYQVRDLLAGCLRSVLASEGIAARVCVVDNASADGSADMVRREFPQVDLIASAVNGGYAYANNLALRKYGFAGGNPADPPRYALLLNPDTKLPPTALRDAVAYMDAHPDIGALGPKVLRPSGALDKACRRSFPTPEVSLYRMLGLSSLFPQSRRFGRYNLTYLDPDQTAEVDSVTGAFMLVRREAVQAAGLLDEAFFMYGEDIDWALRFKQCGYSVVYYPHVSVLHYKGESSRSSDKALREFYRAMLIFYRKHYQHSTFFLLDWLIVSGIRTWGTLAYLRNLTRPKEARRVSR
ncbi:MAG: glycosyltransferase family 2 protein [Chloroflexi bacterium]|nr:glycosyltransferase family 2 protein [Chloroflexota bacterium]